MSASLCATAHNGYVPRRKRPSIWLLPPVLRLVMLSLLPLAYVGLKAWPPRSGRIPRMWSLRRRRLKRRC
jgi:hypothetical protein